MQILQGLSPGNVEYSLSIQITYSTTHLITATELLLVVSLLADYLYVGFAANNKIQVKRTRKPAGM